MSRTSVRRVDPPLSSARVQILSRGNVPTFPGDGGWRVGGGPGRGRDRLESRSSAIGVRPGVWVEIPRGLDGYWVPESWGSVCVWKVQVCQLRHGLQTLKDSFISPQFRPSVNLSPRRLRGLPTIRTPVRPKTPPQTRFRDLSPSLRWVVDLGPHVPESVALLRRGCVDSWSVVTSVRPDPLRETGSPWLTPSPGS